MCELMNSQTSARYPIDHRQYPQSLDRNGALRKMRYPKIWTNLSRDLNMSIFLVFLRAFRQQISAYLECNTGDVTLFNGVAMACQQ